MYSAVILAGGFGTRLKPLTDTVPKPMLPVGGEPNLIRICEHLCKNGFDSAVVTLKYLPEKIKDALSDSCRGVDLFYVCEDEPLGTAGAVKAVWKMLTDDFLVISGDAVCTLDLAAAYEAHKKSGAAVTVITHTVTDPLQYGCVVCDKNGRIEAFCEKPSWQQVVSDKVNTGIYFISRRALDYIPENKEYDFSRDVFPAMLSANEFLLGYEAQGYWRDIGSFAEYLAANRDFADNSKNKAETEGSVCGDSFRLGKNSAFINSVAFDGVSIADNCSVTESILCRNVTVGDGCVLQNGCVIGEGAIINDGVKLGYGTVIQPGKTVIKSKEGGFMIKNKLFCGGCVAVSDNDDVSTELCRLAQAVASASDGPVGVCCDVKGKHANKAELFCHALCDAGASVYDFGAVVKHAAKTAGTYYGCDITVYIRPCEDGLCVEFFDNTGMSLPLSEEKRITDAYRADKEKKDGGKIIRISGLSVLYYNALSDSSDLHGIKVSVKGGEDGAGLPEAFSAAGADAGNKASPYTEKDEYTVNTNDGALLLGQNGFYCSFDSCLLILLSLISPEDQPVISLPYFLPQIYEKTAKSNGIRVLRYLSKPNLKQRSDVEARRLRTSCMWCHDPLFCAARLMSELKRNKMRLSEAADKYAKGVVYRGEITVNEKEKALCMRRLYEAYMPYQVSASDGVSIVEGDAEGVAMADDSDKIRIVLCADSEEAAEDAVGEIMMRLGNSKDFNEAGAARCRPKTWFG
ncbi:MAG: NTP transferase domain-containing protein [Clostridia bacterium]|nr:NTP transferase domain-containing protein [Clostridia bacterium]